MTDYSQADKEKVRCYVDGEVLLLVDQDRAIDHEEMKASLDAILAQVEAPEAMRSAVARVPEAQTRYYRNQPTVRETPQNRVGTGGLLGSLYRLLWSIGLMRRASNLKHDDMVREKMAQVPEHFSLITANFSPGGDAGHEDDPEAVQRSYAALMETLEPLNAALAERNNTSDSGRVNGIRLEGVIPNWLSSSAQGQLVVGGPGTRPTVVNGSPDESATKFSLWNWKNILRHWRFLFGGGGEGVTVAILDTMPNLSQIEQAFNRFVVQRQGSQRHSLLMSLFSADGAQAQGAVPSLTMDKLRLQAYQAQTVASRVMECHAADDPQHAKDVGVLGHTDYVMVDHGLFVAGVIHCIAPKAKLRLIQVLNCYGVGSLGVLMDGIKQLLDDWPAGKVVVNFSLTFALPQTEYARHRPEIKDIPAWETLAPYLERNPTHVSLTDLSLHWLFATLRARGAAVVAASGNEGAAGVHPDARMPAADALVVGVGAVDEAQQVVDYSNQSDSPESAGFYTYGGVATAQGQAASANRGTNVGILGVYTQDLPGSVANDTGWAYWAGTSFATPVLSAALAILMGQGDSAGSAEAYLRKICIKGSTNGDIFEVTQGPT